MAKALKTKYRDMTIFSLFFPSILAIETLQNHFIFEFLDFIFAFWRDLHASRRARLLACFPPSFFFRELAEADTSGRILGRISRESRIAEFAQEIRKPPKFANFFYTIEQQLCSCLQSPISKERRRRRRRRRTS